MLSPARPRSSAVSPARARGSVLVVALMFSIIIGTSLVFFLRVASNATKLSYNTYHLGVAMNIAESGLEQAVWEMRRESGAWADWTPAPGGTGAYQRTFDLGKIDGGSTTIVKVYAQPGSNAYAIARAIVTPPKGRVIEKWVKVTLSKEGRIKVGGLGRKGIVASGNNVVMASWNSDPDKDPSTPYVPFSTDVMRDKMSLATLDLDASLDSGQADVNGKAAVGGSSLGAIKVGPNGYIGPFGTKAGVKDPGSISTNFSTDLPIVTAPDKTYTTLGAINAGVTKLPRGTSIKDGGPIGTPTDTPDSEDGVYYYRTSQVTSSIEVTPGYQVVLLVDNNPAGSISLGGSNYIKVGGQVVTNTITGTKSQSSGQLKIYTSGDVTLSGQSTAVNEIATVSHTPAANYETVLNVTAVTEIMGQGNNKKDVIGWSYTQTSQTTYTLDGVVYTLPETASTTYTRMVTEDPTKPVLGKSIITGDESEALKQTGTLVGQPIALQIYGTRTEEERKLVGTQKFTISGNGSLSAIVYAPNADISAKGGGNSGFMMGSLVGYTLKFTGNDCFYYDESLADEDEGSRLAIDEWDEIVSYADPKNAETYAKMNF